MSNGTIKSWVKGVERRQRILSQTSLMRVEFKYENKMVPTAFVRENGSLVDDDVSRRQDASRLISRDHRLTPPIRLTLR